MAARPLIYPVKSIGTLIDTIGSQNDALVEKTVQAYVTGRQNVSDEWVAKVREGAKSFVSGTLKDGTEPASWGFASHRVAVALDLATEAAVNEDWVWAAWCDYLDFVKPRISGESSALLFHLVHGRPFKASAQEESWEYFAWLERDEVRVLHESLTKLQERDPEVEGAVEGFHFELVNVLEDCISSDLLLVAG